MSIQLHGSRRSVRDFKARTLLEGREPAGDCLRPIDMSIRGAPDPTMVGLGKEKDLPAIVNFSARCRKCETCLRHRQSLWTARAIAECGVSTRTWFGTLTVGPDRRVSALYRAQVTVARSSGERWAQLDTAEQFRYVVDVLSRDVTLYLKRIRKASGVRFRYLLVSEAHKDGFPHFHVLLHEHGSAIPKRCLDAHWRVGFSQWRLVGMGDKAQAGYVCKYLSKSALTRVRASQRYGQASVIAGLAANTLKVLSSSTRSSGAASAKYPSLGDGAPEERSVVGPVRDQ